MSSGFESKITAVVVVSVRYLETLNHNILLGGHFLYIELLSLCLYCCAYRNTVKSAGKNTLKMA